ncbi:hypothetical protein [Chryseobacterium sp. ISL-6]|uniref:hypothetical protein n=1 Tax=Chryseobacterium sp. ISL-6 TaxID=2819143 RepID=UPI001BEAD6A1|nr:hypothetical protein [Chryseobacterium sp. ISL-6]MBT2620289.1 hypothetical protein [Chryseobacterium sp. ISL-6]
MDKYRLLLILGFYIFINSCKSADYRTLRAQDEYKKKLKIIKMFLDEKVIKNVSDLDTASSVLSDLSTIESHKDKGFEFSIMPTKGNYIDWKQWYKENKNIIFWGEEKSKIEVLDFNNLPKGFKISPPVIRKISYL